MSLNNLARFGEAEPLFRRALSIWEKVLGSEHPETVTIRGNYSAFLEKMKQPHPVQAATAP